MAAVIEGSLDGRGLRIAVAAARFNELIVERLVAGAERALEENGVSRDAVDVIWVPGAFELPQVARWLAEAGRYDALVCVGCVIRGETPHFEYVAGQAAAGIERVAVDTGLPVTFGVLTVETLDQALQRAGGKDGNKGAQAAAAAIELATLRRRLRGD